jgi:hypothetical protein
MTSNGSSVAASCNRDLLTKTSVVILNSNTVRITLAADPGGPVAVNFFWGRPGRQVGDPNPALDGFFYSIMTDLYATAQGNILCDNYSMTYSNSHVPGKPARGNVTPLVSPAESMATPTAPSVTLMRNTGAKNTLFNISSGGTTKSNALDVYGTSGYSSATLSVYVDNVVDGTTTTDGSGNWVYTLGSTLSDAAHTIAATVTVSGSTSVKSTTFNVTVTAGLTSLPVSIGQNMVNNQSFSWGGEGFVTNSTNQTTGHVNTACCIVADTHTLDFILKSTDLYTDVGTSNRSEIAMTGRYADGVTINSSWQVWLDPSSPVNDNFGPSEWNVFPTQIHDSGGASPPVEMNLGGDANNSGTTGDQLCIDKYNGTAFSQAFRDSGNLVRGTWHSFDMIAKLHATAGILSVCKNGVQVVSYTGPLFGISPNYQKLGMYRGPTPGEDQDQHYKIRNFLCVRT